MGCRCLWRLFRARFRDLHRCRPDLAIARRPLGRRANCARRAGPIRRGQRHHARFGRQNVLAAPRQFQAFVACACLRQREPIDLAGRGDAVARHFALHRLPQGRFRQRIPGPSSAERDQFRHAGGVPGSPRCRRHRRHSHHALHEPDAVERQPARSDFPCRGRSSARYQNGRLVGG